MLRKTTGCGGAVRQDVHCFLTLRKNIGAERSFSPPMLALPRGATMRPRTVSLIMTGNGMSAMIVLRSASAARAGNVSRPSSLCQLRVARAYLAWCYAQLGMQESAVQHYRQAYTHNKHPTIALGLAQ